MTFPESIRTCMLTKVFTLSGRASRSEFWWFILAGLLFNLFGGLILLIPLLGAIAYFGLSLWFFVANFTVTVRRLHDTDHRGWWLLLPLLGSIVLGVATMLLIGPYYDTISYYDADNFIIGIGAVSTLIVLGSYLILLIFCIKKGTDGPNRFGPDPLQADPQGPGFYAGYGPGYFDPGAAQGYNPNFGPQGPQGPNDPYQGSQGAYHGYGPQGYGPNGPQGPYQGYDPNYTPNVGPNGPYQGPQGSYQGPQGSYQEPQGSYQGPQGSYQGPQEPYQGPYAAPQGQWQQGPYNGPQGSWQQPEPQSGPQEWPYQQPQQFQQGPQSQMQDATFNGESDATPQSQSQAHPYYPEAEQGMYAPPEPPTNARNFWDQDPPRKQ